MKIVKQHLESNLINLSYYYEITQLSEYNFQLNAKYYENFFIIQKG
jgi:hypothetical protein